MCSVERSSPTSKPAQLPAGCPPAIRPARRPNPSPTGTGLQWGRGAGVKLPIRPATRQRGPIVSWAGASGRPPRSLRCPRLTAILMSIAASKSRVRGGSPESEALADTRSQSHARPWGSCRCLNDHRHLPSPLWSACRHGAAQQARGGTARSVGVEWQSRPVAR